MSGPNRVDIASTDLSEDTAAVLSTPGEDGATLVGADTANDALTTANQRRRHRREGPIDLTVAGLAKEQHRIVTWPQLSAAGLSSRAVEHRVATGRLHRVYRGVYLLEPPSTASRITVLAAALAACMPNAMLSHHAAAELWGLGPPKPADIDVTVVGRNPGSKRTGIQVHRAHTLDSRDMRLRQGLHVSAPARVALELSRSLDSGELENLVARARVELSVGEKAIWAVLDRSPGYPGAARLRAVMKQAGGPAMTRAKSERLMLRLVRQTDLPPPAVNLRTGRSEIDFLWQEARLAVEVDGYEFHHDRAAFERDRRRDAKMVASGWRVMRFTWRQIAEKPFTVVARIAQVLGNTAK